jgi:hypothetical protein
MQRAAEEKPFFLIYLFLEETIAPFQGTAWNFSQGGRLMVFSSPLTES